MNDNSGFPPIRVIGSARCGFVVVAGQYALSELPVVLDGSCNRRLWPARILLWRLRIRMDCGASETCERRVGDTPTDSPAASGSAEDSNLTTTRVGGSGSLCHPFGVWESYHGMRYWGMPKPVKQKRRTADPNQWARQIVEQSTAEREAPPEISAESLSAYMAALGRKGGRVGGKRRLSTMTAADRSAIALKAARARWKKAKKR